MRRHVKRARELRSRATVAEQKLWWRLRRRQLGARFRRQHPIAGYILDFYCVSARLAIEVDGGGHADVDQQRYDQRRRRELAEVGVRVLRFWNHDVLNETDAVVELIRASLKASAGAAAGG